MAVGINQVHIPAYSDSDSGIIRTLFRRYPDSDSDVKGYLAGALV